MVARALSETVGNTWSSTSPRPVETECAATALGVGLLLTAAFSLAGLTELRLAVGGVAGAIGDVFSGSFFAATDFCSGFTGAEPTSSLAGWLGAAEVVVDGDSARRLKNFGSMNRNKT